MTTGYSRLFWVLAIFMLVTAVSVPGIVYAVVDARQRTTVLTGVVAVEILLAIGIGLYLRGRAS